MPQVHPRTTPTLKQKKFAKAYVENGGNGLQAALQTYDTNYEGAKSVAHQNINKDVVKKEISQLLDKSGLGLDTLNEYAQEAIKNNLTLGKFSQASGVSLLQFLYKLHNVIPSNKSMKFSVNLKGQLSQENVSEAVKTVKKLSEKSLELAKDLTS